MTDPTQFNDSKSPAGGALITRPGIRVDERGRWYYRSDLIENRAILDYFKKQLRRDANGYYIENRFGPRSEHGYLERVDGFPLAADSLQPEPDDADGIRLRVRLDDGEQFEGPAEALRIFAEDSLGLEVPGRGVPARLSPLAMASLVTYLHLDEHEAYHLVLPEDQRKAPIQRGAIEDLFPVEAQVEGGAPPE